VGYVGTYVSEWPPIRAHPGSRPRSGWLCRCRFVHTCLDNGARAPARYGYDVTYITHEILDQISKTKALMYVFSGTHARLGVLG
jgi:hypothetical protein